MHARNRREPRFELCLLAELTLEARPRVIVAEDQAAMRALVAARLRAAGYEVVEVGDGASLRQILGEVRRNDRDALRHDLVVVDVQMPGCSGLEFLSLVRGENSEIPFIIMTAFGDRAIHEEARRLGAARVFDKPFDVRELVAEAIRLVAPH